MKVLVKQFICAMRIIMCFTFLDSKNMYSLEIFNAQLGVAHRMSLRIAFFYQIIL